MKIHSAVLAVAALVAGCATVVQQPLPRSEATVRVPNGQMELSFVMNHCIIAPYFGGIYQMPTGDGGTMPVLGITCLSNRDGFLVNIFCEPHGMLCRVAPRMQRDARAIRVENELRLLANSYRR